jgi:Rps23 Pro-64 3,4-dihydroxylase Tpa1-like proline 4-hydroxylase
MKVANPFRIDEVEMQEIPFVHFFKQDFVDPELANEILEWFRKCNLWKPRKVKDFYEVADFDFGKATVPAKFDFLKSPSLVKSLVAFAKKSCPQVNGKVDITAHRMTNGEKIKIHTDHGDLDQHFRIIIQFNKDWEISNGGLIMLFDSDSPSLEQETNRIYIPENGSAWGFEISERSFHAVSPIRNNIRYSLVYTFY